MRDNKRIIFIFLFFIFFSGNIFFTLGQETQKNEPVEYNVVLIVINALRPDHLSCYGYSRKTSPNIDELASDSVLFEQAIASSYWTLPSLASVFTSKFVCNHNLNSRQDRLGADQKTLAEVLKSQGYLTVAFTCGLDTSLAYGLDKGFDVYESYSADKPVGSFSDILPAALEMLKLNQNKKFFLFLHSYDVHPPYNCINEESFDRNYKGIFDEVSFDYNTFKQIKGNTLNLGNRRIPLLDKDISHIVARYDDSIRYADSFVGELITKLKALKLYDKTIIILCADHGEELGERGTFNRFGNQNLYQEVIRVPLIVRHPAMASKARRIKSLAGTVDIMPTVLDLLGMPLDGLNLQGRSLSALLKTDSDIPVREFIVAEASKDKWALFWQDGWKLLHSLQKNELYNIAKDPHERNNMVEKQSEIYVRSLEKFFLWRQHHRQEDNAKNRIKLNPDLIKALRKAGYW